MSVTRNTRAESQQMKPKRPAKPKALQPAKPGGGGSLRTVAGGREATFREVVGMI